MEAEVRQFFRKAHTDRLARGAGCHQARLGVDAETGNNDAMDDNAILDQIHELVAEEKRLRHQAGGLTGADRSRLDALERQLDQAWDLLRQRRAREDAGEDPDVARERPPDEVEGYLQ